MVQAFVIVFREGFEAFLIVAIIFSYLKKTHQKRLLPAVGWGVVASIVASGLLGYFLLQQANESLWEAIFGFVGAALVTWLVIHMWRAAPRLKQEMEGQLERTTERESGRRAWLGVLAFTTFMITREGMETALLLIQIHEPRIVGGILMGIAAAVALAFAWVKFGRLINLKLFFQVTALFLLLCVAQILFYSFHEMTELGVLPHSEALHAATEPFSSRGIYGKWITAGIVAICACWLGIAWFIDRVGSKRRAQGGVSRGFDPGKIAD